MKKILTDLEQALALSICLSSEEKEQLLGRSAALSEKQQRKMLRLLEEQQEHQNKMLHDFLLSAPHLFQEYKRLEDKRMSDLFCEAERSEKRARDQRLRELLSTHSSSY